MFNKKTGETFNNSPSDTTVGMKKRRQNLKKIIVPAVLLFGFLLISAIGVSTAAATQPEWTQKSDAVVVTPPEEPPSHNAGGNGEVRAEVHVPLIAILKSPAIQSLVSPDPPIPPD